MFPVALNLLTGAYVHAHPYRNVNVVCRKASSWQGFIKWFQNLSKTNIPRPPYNHVCQVGDPVLRTKAEEVEINKIRDTDVQNVITKLLQVMKTYQAVGISAPQIGVPLRIAVFEFPQKYLKFFPPEVQRSQEMVAFPRKVFINPEMQVVNPHKVLFPEACESVRGYSALVARYHEVELTGFNENGERHTWAVKGWPARIIQHEQDHLDGKMYTDIMNLPSFQYDSWHWVNVSRGKHSQPFSQ